MEIRAERVNQGDSPGVSAEDKPPPRTRKSWKLDEVQNRSFSGTGT